MKFLEGRILPPTEKSDNNSKYFKAYNPNEKPSNSGVNKKTIPYESFSSKREFLYKIMIEIGNLTGPQGLIQNEADGKFDGLFLFENVESFFNKITSSTFKKNIVKALIVLSEMLKEAKKITIEDQKEFLNQIKCDIQSKDDSLQNKKKMKAKNKLVGLLQQQDQIQDQNNEEINNQINKSFKIIKKNLKEIFLK
ncbi:unnamed protein product [Paramecium octaurelia]|uniref:Uncharacterized protein n=1 Tax=Paramecium octaurelia TaxID=43137 RepID=A0A8S1XF50_PAROT|nr:unnamed protein product [Paramecium octaurelia]